MISIIYNKLKVDTSSKKFSHEDLQDIPVDHNNSLNLQ